MRRFLESRITSFILLPAVNVAILKGLLYAFLFIYFFFPPCGCWFKRTCFEDIIIMIKYYYWRLTTWNFAPSENRKYVLILADAGTIYFALPVQLIVWWRETTFNPPRPVLTLTENAGKEITDATGAWSKYRLPYLLMPSNDSCGCPHQPALWSECSICHFYSP